MHVTEIKIAPYDTEYKQDVIDLTVKAWAPVFAKTQNEVPSFVFKNFYPKGWQMRQTSEVEDLLDAEPQNIWLAMHGKVLVGFLGLSIHAEDQMGEIYIIAVSPDFQRQGISTKLMQFAEDHIRALGMKMIMVETIGDNGHKPARHAYESFGFEQWPVARYFKEL